METITTISSQKPFSSTEKVIEVRDLEKRFGSQEVLKKVSLDLFKGENLVVLGKSGTGKSVLIKCIVRLLIPDSGSINVLGNTIENLKPGQLGMIRRKIGFLFQGGALYDSMTVKQNLEFPLRRLNASLSEKEIKEKTLEVLENVGLSEALNKMPSQLSGGMRKRISLARTIIVDPAIILYDEPTTGLDPITSEEISLLINKIQEKYKTASIIITHDIKCAKITANRLVMLENGSITSEGCVEDYEKSTDPVIRSFFN